MLVQDRTPFDKGFTKVFHVVAYGSNYYSDLVAKYGADNVFRAASATIEDKAFRDAVAACLTGRNDQIKVYPGTYTFAAAVTVNKGCTIEAANGNAGSVIIDLATSDVAGFVVSAAGVTIRNMVINGEDAAGATIIIASTAAATVVENITFVGTATSTGAMVDLDGDYSVVRGCIFQHALAAIQVDGSYCRVEDNMVNSAIAASVGIELTASTTGKNTACVVKNNILNLQQATNTIGIKVGGPATGCVASGNAVAVLAGKDVVAAAVSDIDCYYSVVSNTSAAGQVGAVVSTS